MVIPTAICFRRGICQGINSLIKIVLVWNYKDGTKTVTLKDIEGSDLSLNTAVKTKGKKDLLLTKPVNPSPFLVDLLG